VTFGAFAAHRTTHMAVGFALMGGWAWFANRTHPMPAPLLAALVQGTMSALLTLLFKTLMDRILGLLIGLPAVRRHAGFGAGLAIALTTGTVFTLSNLILRGGHALAGTPEIGATIVFPVIVVTLYALAYSTLRWRRMQLP
jgi:hypothetical protein